MIKTSASQLKAKLGKFMQAARSGQEVIVTDRGVPVARLGPIAAPPTAQGPAITPRDPAAPPPGKVQVKGIPYRGTDSTALLREDRRR